MISEIIDQISKQDYYNSTESIEIVKGKYELVTTWKGCWRKIKRGWRLRKQ